MKKNFTILLLVLIIMAMLGSTISQAATQPNAGDIKIWEQSFNGYYKTFDVVDSVSGVHYVGISIDHGHPAIAMCPRYNADGSLFTGN